MLNYSWTPVKGFVGGTLTNLTTKASLRLQGGDAMEFDGEWTGTDENGKNDLGTSYEPHMMPYFEEGQEVKVDADIEDWGRLVATGKIVDIYEDTHELQIEFDTIGGSAGATITVPAKECVLIE